MRKVAIAFLLIFAGGCSMKEAQRPDLIGDSQSKLYFKNVPTNEAKIPSDRRVYFKNMDEAMEQGYKNSQEGGGDGKSAGSDD